MRTSRLVARQELLDLFRNRQVWVSLLLQPMIFLSLIVLFGYIGQQRGEAFRTKEFKAVVSGDARDTKPFDDALRSHNFRIIRGRDIQGPILGNDAEVGLVIPSNAARDLDAGRSIALKVYYEKNRDISEVALARLRNALDEFSASEVGRRLELHGLSQDLTRPLIVRTTDAGSTTKGVRDVLGLILPGFVLLQSTSLLTTAAGRLSGRKDKRTLEPLLLLPVRRIDILRGAGVASFTIGLIPVLAYIVPVVAATLLPFVFHGDLSSSTAVAIGLVAVGPLLAALMVGVGLVVGALGRGSEGGSSLGGLAFAPFMALGMLFLLVNSLPHTLSMYAIPAYGAAMLMRTTISDGFVLLPFLIVLASTAVAVTVLIRLAATYLDTERAVLRPSG